MSRLLLSHRCPRERQACAVLAAEMILLMFGAILVPERLSTSCNTTQNNLDIILGVLFKCTRISTYDLWTL